jgi:hypothetical protein
MSLTDEIRAAHAALFAAYSEATVTLTIRGVSGSAVRSSRRRDASFGDMGQDAPQIQTVWVSAATVAEPDAGETVTVDGLACTVTATALDPVGGLLRIDYQRQRGLTA